METANADHELDIEGRPEERQEPWKGRQEPRRPLVLMVDDNPHHGEIYGRMLCYNGFDVVHVADGARGLAAARRRRPDLVLLDLMMPGLDGLDVCRQLLAEAGRNAPRVAVLSSRSAKEWESKARRAGADVYLEKPLSAVRVLHAVEELVGRAPLPGSGSPPQFVSEAAGRT